MIPIWHTQQDLLRRQRKLRKDMIVKYSVAKQKEYDRLEREIHLITKQLSI